MIANPDLRMQLGVKVKQYTNENFTWDSIKGKYLTLFGQILM